MITERIYVTDMRRVASLISVPFASGTAWFPHASYLYSTTTFLRTVKYSTNISLDILSIVYLL